MCATLFVKNQSDQKPRSNAFFQQIVFYLDGKVVKCTFIQVSLDVCNKTMLPAVD